MPASDHDPDLRSALTKLERQVAHLNAQPFFRWQAAPIKSLGYAFLRGISFGLGSVVGATLFVSILVYMLSQVDFIPIVGDWAKQIADQITTPP